MIIPVALRFINMKIKLHEIGHEFKPRAHLPIPSSGDFYFTTETPSDRVVSDWQRQNSNQDYFTVR